MIRLIALAILLVFFSRTASAQNACDAAFVNAFRENLHVNDGLSLAQSAQDYACNKSNQSFDVEATGYGSLKNIDVKEACQSHDRRFFSKYSHELALSFIPPDSLKAIATICGSANLSVEAERNGQTIAISAHWVDHNNEHSAEIKSFYFPRDMAKCEPLNFHNKAVVGTGGLQQFCTVLKDGPVTFGLNTNKGSVYAVVKPKALPSSYKLVIYSVDDDIACSLNGAQIASMSYGQPRVEVTLTPVAGRNVLVCAPHDQHPDGAFNPCWAYKFDLRKNAEIVLAQEKVCCGSGCPIQPNAIPYSFDFGN
jgi:hypothetical protein